MHICTQEHNTHWLQKNYFERFCSQSCSIFFCFTCNHQSKSYNDIRKAVKLGHQSLFSQRNLTHPQILKWILVYYLFLCFLITGLPLTAIVSWIKRSLPSQAQLWNYQPQVFIYTSELKKFLPRQFQNAIYMKKVLLKEVFYSTILSQEITCQCHTVLQKKKNKLFFLNEYQKDPNKTQHGSITWKHFKFN